MKGRSPTPCPGFTLIELMVVLGIVAVLMGVAVPYGYNMLNKEGMARAVEIVTEACHRARARAIFSGGAADMAIEPLEGRFRVPRTSATGSGDGRSGGRVPRYPSWRQGDSEDAGGGGYSARLPPGIEIEMVDVNYVEYAEREEARVRFYPNGTSDKLTIVLKKDDQWRGISLDVMTGVPQVETDPEKFEELTR